MESEELALDLTEILTKRLDRDTKAAARLLPLEEVRYLVDLYYGLQRPRIAASNTCSAVGRDNKIREAAGEVLIPVPTMLASVRDSVLMLEGRIAAVLNEWAKDQEMGRWCLGVKGIGPVLTGGLLSQLDVTKSPTAGGFWRFAGLDPSIVWGKGEKRPYNADLKTLCAYKVGESFVKVSGLPGSVYGRIYKSSKELYVARNDAGDYGDQARTILASPRAPARTTDAFTALTAGRLPQAQIHARARRRAVKIFLSHLHAAMWSYEYGTEPPNPYPLAFQGHTHYIAPEVPYPQHKDKKASE